MYIAIVKTKDNRIAKFQHYKTAADAQSHTDRVKPKFPDAFVYGNAANTPIRDLQVTGQTVTIVPVVDHVPTAGERIDRSFPQTDMARVIFESFFEIANRLQVLEGKPPISKAQMRDWLKAKLP